MKQVLFIALFAFVALSANAQSFKDTFDSNTLGWTEMSSSDGEAVIKEGVMHLQGKKNGSNFYIYTPGTDVMTSAYTTFDPQQNFEIKCKAVVKKINEKNPVGIMINYQDDYNYMLFSIDEKNAYFWEYREGKMIAYRQNAMRLRGKRNEELSFQIKSTYNKIEFIVNNMTAIELRYKPITSNGIGFYLYGAQTADFDDLEIIQ